MNVGTGRQIVQSADLERGYRCPGLEAGVAARAYSFEPPEGVERGNEAASFSNSLPWVAEQVADTVHLKLVKLRHRRPERLALVDVGGNTPTGAHKPGDEVPVELGLRSPQHIRGSWLSISI
jgi:hypothetical protein